MNCRWALFGGLLFGVLGACGRVKQAGNAPEMQASAGSTSDAGAGGAGGAASGGAPRLVPWQLQPDGSEPLVVGIYDTQEHMHCQFLPDSHGVLRCLPETLTSALLTETFADPQCLQPIYQVDAAPASGAVGRLVSLPQAPLDQVCAAPGYIVGQASLVADGAPTYGGEPCVPQGMETLPAMTSLTVDSIVAPERWATGSLVEGPELAGQVHLQRVVSDDGASFDAQLVDERWSTACALVDSAPPYCVPKSLSTFTTLFSDAACLQPIWRLPQCFASFIGNGFPGSVSFGLGAPFSDPVYTNGGGHGGCRLNQSPPPPAPPERFFEKGPPLSGDVIAQVQLQAAGSGQLQLQGLRGTSGELVPIANWLAAAPRFHDTVAAADCNPIWTPEGLVRCLPSNAFIYDAYAASFAFYADDKCSELAFTCNASLGCGGTVAVFTAPDARGERAAVSLRATVPVTSGLYMPAADGTCAPLPPGAASSFTLGDALPWELYPAIAEQNGRTPSTP
jgi:hypothetical protein